VIRNISTASYGNGQQINRKIQLRLTPKNSPAKSNWEFSVNRAANDPQQSVTIEIPSLASKAQTLITVTAKPKDKFEVKDTFRVEAELFIAADLGEGPTKLIGRKILDFTVSRDVAPEFEYEFTVKDMEIRCQLEGSPETTRRIDDIWMTKPAQDRGVSFSFDTTMWWFNDSPQFQLDFNDIERFVVAKTGNQPMTAQRVRNFFNKKIIPLMAKAQNVDKAWIYRRCSIQKCGFFKGLFGKCQLLSEPEPATIQE
jgi:hypothetical protein